MVDWQAARAFTETACAEIFDVTDCQLIPMTTGLTVNHKGGPDPSREPFPFVGTIDLEPPSDRIARHLSNDPGSNAKTVSYDAVLSAHVGTWLYLPKRGDHIQSGTDTYKIAAIEKDGSSRPAWYLTRV
jgi:hypothetical protein